MQRVYTDHLVRKVTDLNGVWKFCTDPADEGKDKQWFCGLKGAQNVTIPSVWNNTMGHLKYEGAAWYEKEFYCEGGCLRFCFEGVMTEADVWLDGTHLGCHYGGFTQFDFIVRDVAPGNHRLTLLVDNRFTLQSVPAKKVDWYHYGGITRSVSVEILKDLCVLNNHLEYSLNENRTVATCRFVLELYNASSDGVNGNVTARLGGEAVCQEHVAVDGNSYITVTTPDFTVNNVRLWDPADPNLYEIKISTDTDDLLDRTGFRTVEVVGQAVHINGKRFELRGVNRHEDHPDWGMAFPQGLMYRDLDILQDMGCNTVRGSHYPNAQIFVDMMDERGIPFWSEIPFWGGGFKEEVCADPVVVERGLQMHREMVKHYYNHPSIIIWGMHNEMPTFCDPMLEMTKLYYAFLKENGGNRLVTYATDKPLKDICLEYCDIICLNRYTGWYYSDRDGWPEEIESFRQRRKELGMEHKPVIYSEFGGAAVYGHHTFDDLWGTEEYQAELHAKCLKAFHEDPMVAGFYVWQFCDTRTCRPMGLDRARSYNNKGIVNEYRKPKMAYYAIKKAYHEFAAEDEE